MKALVYRPRFPTDPMVDEVEKAADETAISAVGRNFNVGISNRSRFYETKVLKFVKFGCWLDRSENYPYAQLSPVSKRV